MRGQRGGVSETGRAKIAGGVDGRVRYFGTWPSWRCRLAVERECRVAGGKAWPVSYPTVPSMCVWRSHLLVVLLG